MARCRIGEADVDFARRVIERDGNAVAVEPKVMAVLHLLADHSGVVVSREQLIETIWDVRFGGDERLSRAISVLRHALGDSGGAQTYIETIPKNGYRLVQNLVENARTPDTEPSPEIRPAIAPHSIAVFPFDDMTGHEGQRYMSDGIAEEVINALAHVPNLQVAGRISSFAAREDGLDLQQVAKKLAVAFVLEGSVRQSASVTRITAQLIDTSDGFQRWSEEFDGQANELFALYEKVATSVTKNVANVLNIEEADHAPNATEREADIYQMFLQGRNATHERDGEQALPLAVELLGQVVERDPTYPEAWAFLAVAHFFMLEYCHTPDWKHHLSEAKRATVEATKLAPNAPTTTIPQLFTAAHEGRMDRHAELVEGLAERIPGQALAEFYLSTTLAGSGLVKQGLEHLEHALAAEPMSIAGTSLLGTAHHILGNAESSEEPYLEAFESGVTSAGLTAAWLLADRGLANDAKRILTDHYDDFRPLLQNLFGWLARPALISSAIAHRANWARSILTFAMRRRIEAGLVQPNAGALLVPMMLGRPELLMLACRKVSAVYLPGTLVHIWGHTREAMELRQHSTFPEFIRETGMTHVWQKFGWPEGIDRSRFELIAR